MNPNLKCRTIWGNWITRTSLSELNDFSGRFLVQKPNQVIGYGGYQGSGIYFMPIFLIYNGLNLFGLAFPGHQKCDRFSVIDYFSRYGYPALARFGMYGHLTIRFGIPKADLMGKDRSGMPIIAHPQDYKVKLWHTTYIW